MGWLSDNFGAVAGLAGDVVGGLWGRSNAKYSAGLAYDNWVKQQSNAHQLEVKDLRAAGLNPILSATNSHIAGIGSAPSITTPDFGGNLSRNIVAAGQLRQSKRELEQTAKRDEMTFQIGKQRLSIDELNAATRKQEVENQGMLIASQIGVNNATTGKIAADTQKAYGELQEIFQRMRDNHMVSMATVDKLRSGTALDYATANKVSAEIEHLSADTEYVKAKRDEINRILTDPKAAIERKLWADALEGNNALGTSHAVNIGVGELTGWFPFRIGFGFRR